MLQVANAPHLVNATNGSDAPVAVSGDSDIDDQHIKFKKLLRLLEFLQVQEEFINVGQNNLKKRRSAKNLSSSIGINYYALLVITILTLASQLAPVECSKNFINGTDCFFAYMDGGNYSIANPDIPNEPRVGSFVSFLLKDFRCFEESDMAFMKISTSLEQPDNNANSLELEFFVKNWANQGYWEIIGVNANFKLTFPLPGFNGKEGTVSLIPEDTWAGKGYSFSCNKLDLFNLPSAKIPQIKITLRRFQMQPFRGGKTVFAESFDCAVWLTLPLIMGIALLLLFTFTVMILIYLMVELGNQTCDLKFCKQAGILMNQSQLENTKG